MLLKLYSVAHLYLVEYLLQLTAWGFSILPAGERGGNLGVILTLHLHKPVTISCCQCKNNRDSQLVFFPILSVCVKYLGFDPLEGLQPVG